MIRVRVIHRQCKNHAHCATQAFGRRLLRQPGLTALATIKFSLAVKTLK